MPWCTAWTANGIAQGGAVAPALQVAVPVDVFYTQGGQQVPGPYSVLQPVANGSVQFLWVEAGIVAGVHRSPDGQSLYTNPGPAGESSRNAGASAVADADDGHLVAEFLFPRCRQHRILLCQSLYQKRDAVIYDLGQRSQRLQG